MTISATPPNTSQGDEDARQRDELLRKALATPPISNEDIVKKARESRKEWGAKAPGR